MHIGVPASAIPSACVITADIACDGWNLRSATGARLSSKSGHSSRRNDQRKPAHYVILWLFPISCPSGRGRGGDRYGIRFDIPRWEHILDTRREGSFCGILPHARAECLLSSVFPGMWSR